MKQNLCGSITAFPNISELFPFMSEQAYCYIHILKEETIWFYVLYEHKKLDFYYIVRLPYLTRENALQRLWAILPGIIGNSLILILEGICLLEEADRGFLISRLSEYSIQNGISFVLVPENL